MDNTALAVKTQESYLSPAASVHDALARYQAMKDFVSSVLKQGVDYGIIPGSTKPSLYKPGAEKLASFFGLRPIFPVVERGNDWTGKDHGGEPFFLRDYKCQLYRDGELIGEGCGSCNSWESKYRYRSQNRVCPKCGKDTIIKGREDYGGGWVCFVKKGGCSAKFADNDPAIIDQPTGKVKNTEVYDQVNTIDKMAQKRALIAAVLIATNASDYFTQDMEDFVDAEFIEQPPTPVTPAPKAAAKKGKDVLTNNGHTRPFEPEILKAKFAELIPWFQKKIDDGESASKESDEFVISNHIESVWAGDKAAEQKRHEVTNYLIGKTSVKEFTDAEKLAFKHWLKITKDDSGEWVHCKEAGIEAVKVYEQSMIDAGQMTLPVQ